MYDSLYKVTDLGRYKLDGRLLYVVLRFLLEQLVIDIKVPAYFHLSCTKVK